MQNFKLFFSDTDFSRRMYGLRSTGKEFADAHCTVEVPWDSHRQRSSYHATGACFSSRDAIAKRHTCHGMFVRFSVTLVIKLIVKLIVVITNIIIIIFAHQHKAAGVKTKQNVKQQLHRLLIRCSLC